MIRVGMIGPPDREELTRLAIRLEERGAEGVVLDSHRDPEIRIERESEFACGSGLADLRAIYVADLGIRTPWVRGEDGSCDIAASVRALRGSRRHLAAWNALLERLGRRMPVVNPPRTHDLHALKPWEMAVYAREGIPVPTTVATSSPETLTALGKEACAGRIRKGMVGGYGYTEPFAPPQSRAEAAERLAAGPLMVQERIEGENVRAFVLGGEVIGAAEVVPADATSVDSRQGEGRLRRISLPASAARAALAAAERWGMAFCAVDFMREAASGRHLVLECNSSPFFVNFERLSGCDISSRLADHLLARGRTSARQSAQVAAPGTPAS